MIVVDASALVDTLLREPGAAPLAQVLFDPGHTFHAPHLLDIEVAHAIRRHAFAGAIDDERGRMVLADLADFPLRRYPHDFLLPRVWSLRANMSVYDAVYVALAELLDAPLLTRDHRLAAAARQHADIEVI